MQDAGEAMQRKRSRKAVNDNGSGASANQGGGSRVKRYAMFHSGNEFPIQELKNTLDLKRFECTRDSHGNNFTFFVTRGQKRVNQILHVFQEFNRDYPSKAIQIEGGLGLDPPIVTFNIHENYKNHHIYLKIKSAEAAKQSGGDVSYKIWTPTIQKQLDRKDDHAIYEADNASKPADRQLLSRWNNESILSTYSHIETQASKKHPLLVEQLFNPEMLAEVEKWDLIEQKLKEDENENEFEPACQGSVYFASTPTLPGILKIGGTKFDGATRVRQLYTAGVPERYTCHFDFRCSDWKLFEGVVHEITKASRVYKRKEFFFMQSAAAAKLIDQLNGTIPRTYDEQSKWDDAFKKITGRLQKSRASWAKQKAKRPREEDWTAGPSRAQMAAAMDKLTEENALLRTQNRARPTESTG